MRNRAPLAQAAFTPLPLTAVKPTGWLREPLRLRADGLMGHLDEFWPDLGPTSAWLGGSGQGWERGPYFMDGLVPLAHLLGNAAKSRIGCSPGPVAGRAQRAPTRRRPGGLPH